MNTDISSQPVFYLFIAFTLLLTLGYSWGRRRNRGIHLSAFNALVETVQPKDQTFTNIGGLTGYHANLIPKQSAAVNRLDATITLLPRQSWLYFPFSLLTMRFDRLFISLSLTRKAVQGLKEGHLIEQGYASFRAPKIEAAERLRRSLPPKYGYRRYPTCDKEQGNVDRSAQSAVVTLEPAYH